MITYAKGKLYKVFKQLEAKLNNLISVDADNVWNAHPSLDFCPESSFYKARLILTYEDKKAIWFFVLANIFVINLSKNLV